MASVKGLKKNINDVLSDIIEECYICQLEGDDKTNVKAEKVIDEAILTFDDLIVKLNQKNVDNKKKHFNSIHKELRTKAEKLLDKIGKLQISN